MKALLVRLGQALGHAFVQPGGYGIDQAGVRTPVVTEHGRLQCVDGCTLNSCKKFGCIAHEKRPELSRKVQRLNLFRHGRVSRGAVAEASDSKGGRP